MILMRKTLALMAFGALAGALAAPASAQPQPAASAPTADAARLPFDSVAAALNDLQARDGNGTIVTHADGWTIVNESLASAQWSFTPDGHYAHPSVVRRVIRRGPNGAVSVETASLCEAPKAECSKLLADFAALNERITQAVKSRGRQGSTPPAQ
jgi:hypothetical protein